MSAVADLMRELINRGMDAAEAAALVARAGAEMSTPTRSKAAARTARWRENKASQSVTERHAVTVPETKSEPSPTVTERHKASQRDGAHISKKEIDRATTSRASRLPEGWKPSDEDVAYALAKGMHLARVAPVAEKFKNHWLSKSGKNATAINWHLKWCTWVMNEIEWNGAKANRPGQLPLTPAGNRWPDGIT